MEKKEMKKMKQFILDTKNDYLYYLGSIYVRLEGIHNKLTDRLAETKVYIKSHEKDSKIPFDDYDKYKEKLNFLINYALNLIGDAQKTSISYFKFRKLVDKKKENKEFLSTISDLDDEMKSILKGFNSSRNFSNHCPESILTSERMILGEKYDDEYYRNFLLINTPLYCTSEYLDDLYKESKNISDGIRKVLEVIEKDYNAILGKEVEIIYMDDDEPRGMDNKIMEAVKKASDIQNS